MTKRVRRWPTFPIAYVLETQMQATHKFLSLPLSLSRDDLSPDMSSSSYHSRAGIPSCLLVVPRTWDLTKSQEIVKRKTKKLKKNHQLHKLFRGFFRWCHHQHHNSRRRFIMHKARAGAARELKKISPQMWLQQQRQLLTLGKKKRINNTQFPKEKLETDFTTPERTAAAAAAKRSVTELGTRDAACE